MDILDGALMFEFDGVVGSCYGWNDGLEFGGPPGRDISISGRVSCVGEKRVVHDVQSSVLYFCLLDAQLGLR